LIEGVQPLGLIPGILQFHPIEQGVGASMTTAYARMVKVVEHAEIRTMPFEWLEEGW
jgi:hypothetical protein